MPFPADENYVYQLNLNTTAVEQVIRWQFAGGLPTDNTRLVTRVACNIPNASDAAIVLGANRRLASNDPSTPEPFRSPPFSGNTHRQVLSSTPANAVTTLANYLTPSIYISERDMYTLFYLTYLGRLEKAKIQKGQIKQTDWNNILFLSGLVGSSFVTNAVLPELPRYFS